MLNLNKENLLDLEITKLSQGYEIKYSRLIKSRRIYVSTTANDEVEILSKLFNLSRLDNETFELLANLSKEAKQFDQEEA